MVSLFFSIHALKRKWNGVLGVFGRRQNWDILRFFFCFLDFPVGFFSIGWWRL